MFTQLRSELLKLATVRTTAIFAGATVLFVVAMVLLQAGTADGELVGPLTDPATQRALFTTAAFSPLVTIVYGTLTITTELRHRTIGATLLVTPDRLRVVIAKAGATVLAGATLAALGAVVAITATALVLAVTGTPSMLSPGDLVGPVVGTIAAAGLGALFGLGVGGVVRNQALAIGTALLLLLAVEPLVGSFLPDVAVWLPASLTATLADAGTTTEQSLVGASAVLAGYGLVTTAAAALVLRRADLN